MIKVYFILYSFPCDNYVIVANIIVVNPVIFITPYSITKATFFCSPTDDPATLCNGVRLQSESVNGSTCFAPEGGVQCELQQCRHE